MKRDWVFGKVGAESAAGTPLGERGPAAQSFLKSERGEEER